jgi:Arc/MetJ-type ribon-helix-helix transcriptional regulator
MRTAKVVSISLPPDMQEEVTKIANEERRSVSEVLREAFRQYAASRALTEVRKQAKKTAKSRQIKATDIVALVAQGRR